MCINKTNLKERLSLLMNYRGTDLLIKLQELTANVEPTEETIQKINKDIEEMIDTWADETADILCLELETTQQ